MMMRFKIVHDPLSGMFVAGVLEVETTKPMHQTYEDLIAQGKSPRWASTSANRVMKHEVAEAWLLTSAHADLVANYPEKSWRTKPDWKKLKAHSYSGCMMLQFNDPKQALRFKLSWHDQEVSSEPA